MKMKRGEPRKVKTQGKKVDADDYSQSKLIIDNAWNEYLAESKLESDTRNGLKYQELIKKAVKK